jgi:alpha-tubulin suppressor-like RCC1 family protein
MVEFSQAGAPTPIADAIAVAAGRNHTCVLHEGGTKVSCAGDDRMGGSGWTGALGRGGATIAGGVDPVAAPVALPNGTVVKSLHAAGNGFYAGHTCVIPDVGRPICWGSNTYVQIAPTSYGRPTPFQIDAYYTAPQLVALGRDFTCVSYVNSELGPRIACQGSNGEGQFGDGTSGVSSDAIPNDVVTAPDGSTTLSGADVELMAAGTAFVCVKLASGGVTCWGSNSGNVYGTTGASRSYADLSALVPSLP